MHVYAMPGHLIRRLNQLSHHVFSKRMAEAGVDLTSVQFAALDAISANPGIDQAGVAASIAYDRATIGGVIDRLESKGFVARKVSKQDRRAREVRLTERGEQAFADILPVVSDLQDEILSGLDEKERETFLQLATKAIRNAPDMIQPESAGRRREHP